MDGIWCHECGRSNNRDCPEHGPLQDIPDRVIPPMAHLTLPKGLVIRPNLKTHPLKVSERGVFAKRVIPARSKFGPVVAPPFPADANYTPVQTNSLILKVFNGGESIQSVVTLDMTDNSQCNWMMFVRSACLADTQQNLEAYQCDGKIYFVAIRTIHIGDELRVGYAANYARLMLEKTCLTVSDSVLSDINTGSGISEDSSVESHTVQQDNSYDEGMETVSTESDVKGELTQLPFPSDVVRVLERSRPRRHFSFTSSRATGSKSSVAAKVCKENISIDNVIHGTKSKELKIERKVDVCSSATPLEAGGIGNQNLKRVTRSSKAAFGQMLLGTSDTDDIGSKITKLALISPPSVMRKRSRKNECVSCKLERRGGHSGGNNNGSSGSGRMCAHGRKVLHRCTTENCSKVFVSKFLLDRHMLIHSAPRNHKCFFCEKSFGRRDHLTSHLNTHKPDKPTWVCKQCGKQYISRFMHKTHMAMHAAEKGKINNCPICNKKYDNKDDLLLHLKIHGGIVYPKGLDKTHKCVECSKVFSKRKDMKRHLVVHSRKKEYKCIYCSQLFSRRGHLNLHFQRFHSHPADCGEICSSSSSSVSTNAVSLPTELSESCQHDANRDAPHLTNVLIPDASHDNSVAETTNANPVSASDVAMATTLPDSNSTKCDDDEDDDEEDDDDNDDDDDDDVVGDDESKMSPPPQTALSRLSISDKDFSPEEAESMKLYKSSFNPTLFSKNPFEKASCSEVPGLSSDVIQYVSTDSGQSTTSRGVPRPASASGTVPPSSPVSSHQHQQGCSTTYPCTPEKSGLASSTTAVSPPLLSLSNIETTEQNLYDVQKKQLYTAGTVSAATSLSDAQLNKETFPTPSSVSEFDTTITAAGAKSQHGEGDTRLAACQKYLEQLQLYREGLAAQPIQDKALSALDVTCESSSSMWHADAKDTKQQAVVDHTNTKSF